MKRIIPVLLGLFVFFSLAAPALAALPVQEAALLDGGGAYEVNPDSEGWLWISDLWAGEVWRLNPTTGEYSSYDTAGLPADARRNGNIFWWVDGGTKLIGRAEVDDGDSNGTVAYTLWEVPDASYFWGTTLDSAGRLWTSDGAYSKFYRLTVNPAGTSGEICIFDIPNSGTATYMTYDDPYLWLGDRVTPLLLRLNVNDNTYEWYQLPFESFPFGIAVDAQGDVWFADEFRSILAELDPESHLLTSYQIPKVTIPPFPEPVDVYPQMITIKQKQIWYSSNGINTIGALDSTTANFVNDELIWDGGTFTPSCTLEPIAPYESGNMEIINHPVGSISWTPTSYETLVDANGWQIFGVPDGGSVSNPWGIAYQNGHVWMVDNGRQKLVEIDSPPNTADLTLTLTGTPAIYDSVGDVISYTYLLTNSGSANLVAPFTVFATKVSNETCPDSPTSLSPGGSITCTGSYTITQADLDAGSVISIASAHAISGTSPVNSNLDSTRTDAVQSAALTFVKTALPTTYSKAGDVIVYTFELTNSGNATLSAPFTITDDKALNESCPITPTSLAPGQKITCTASYTITGEDIAAVSVTNNATGHGYLGEIVVDSNQDSATVNYVPPPDYEVFLPLILR